MYDDDFYKSPEWLRLRDRVLARDGYRCTVARILGGKCRGPLHVHHIEKRRDRPDLQLDPDNCGTCCASHHPKWEALCAWVRRARQPLPPCRHNHRYASGREACERERARKLGIPWPQAA